MIEQLEAGLHGDIFLKGEVGSEPPSKSEAIGIEPEGGIWAKKKRGTHLIVIEALRSPATNKRARAISQAFLLIVPWQSKFLRFL
jgi:hypothetical protein